MTKKTTLALTLLAFSAVGVSTLSAAKQTMTGTKLPFYVYHAPKSPDNHYAPSGWMGDYGDLRYDEYYKAKTETKPHIRVVYSAQGKQGAGWAGIYWQQPPNNWGNREGGYNLNGAQKLIFMARGENGGETISEFKVGGMEGDYRDSGAAALGPVTLTKDWKEYAIPLEGQELSNIAGGFCLTMNRDNNPQGATVHLDNIRFE